MFKYGEAIDIPIRPHWSYEETAVASILLFSSLSNVQEALNAREKKYFEDYLTRIYKTYKRERLNYFEHNLEVWRYSF